MTVAAAKLKLDWNFKYWNPRIFRTLILSFLSISYSTGRPWQSQPNLPRKTWCVSSIVQSLESRQLSWFCQVMEKPCAALFNRELPKRHLWSLDDLQFGRFGTKRKSARLSWIAPLAQFLFCAPGDFWRWLEGDWTNFPSPWPRAVLRYILWCRDTLQVWNYTENISCFEVVFFPSFFKESHLFIRDAVYREHP